jgi:hypothetical protein
LRLVRQPCVSRDLSSLEPPLKLPKSCPVLRCFDVPKWHMRKLAVAQMPEPATGQKLADGDNEPPAEAGFIDEKELLRRVPVSRRTLFGWRESGKIPCVRLPGSRRVLFHWPSVEAALLRLQRGGVE